MENLIEEVVLIWGKGQEAIFYSWKKKYRGLSVSELRRPKQLEEENQQLKRKVTDLGLDKQMLQDVLSKSFKAC